MGIVKFNNTHLNVEGIPDGHVVIPEAELSNLRSIQNTYLGMKSKLPIGVPEDQIAGLVEKGQRYDSVATENTQLKTEKGSLETKIQGYSNLPKDFSAERWNNYVQREQAEQRKVAVDKLTAEVLADVEKETGVKYTVDPRFLNNEAVTKFDPKHADAKKQWREILDSAHTEQQKFLQNQLGAPSANRNAQPGQPPQPGVLPNDGVDGRALRIDRL